MAKTTARRVEAGRRTRWYRRLLRPGGGVSIGSRRRAGLAAAALLTAAGLGSSPSQAQVPAARPGIAPTGTVHGLALFARFQDEVGESSPAAWSAQLFDPDLPGSLTHFYDEMSRGQLALTGAVLPRVYSSRSPASAYLATSPGQPGGFGRFVTEVLQAADGEVDFGQFDSDGPDGIPNSGDDDGFVDFLFVIAQSTPSRFVVSDADGIQRLGLTDDYVTGDPAARRSFIRVRGDNHPVTAGGTIQRGRHFAEAVGTMAHEFGHALGLPDLYDTGSVASGGAVDPDEDSAGIGYWGLMGHGARGWDDAGGPNPLCAWSLEQLGWIGPGNADLIRLRRAVDGLELRDPEDGGKVYRLDAPGVDEYFLLEYRARGSSYYERDLPAEGLLIWHVRGGIATNDTETHKRVDLVCADGLYRDAGYPQGLEQDPDGGRDNLDFWAHDEVYRQARGGNLGDATDPFDGIAYTEFSPVTNPASGWFSVANIRRSAGGMTADVVVRERRHAGVLSRHETWSDTVEVIGDVTIPAGLSLSIDAGTVVRFGADGRRGGDDPERCELVVEGALTAAGSRTTVFTSTAAAPAPGDWVGVRVRPGGELHLRNVAIDNAVDGVRGAGLWRDLRLVGVKVGRPQRHGLWVEGSLGSHTIEELQVEEAGGSGAVLEGTATYHVTRPRIANSAASGLVRAGGHLDLQAAELFRNGLEAPEGANLVLREGVFGQVAGSRFLGGVGIRAAGAGLVSITDNEFVQNRIGLVVANATVRVVANRFLASDLVMAVSGGRLPERVELNVVEGATRLVANESPRIMTATNNWWGASDRQWIAARMAGAVDWEPFLTFDPRIPVGFGLSQSSPNPFTTYASIDYTVGLAELTVSGDILTVLEIHAVTGARVRRLVEEVSAPGSFSVVWDGLDDGGRPAASGVYYYELQVGPIRLRRKLTLVR